MKKLPRSDLTAEQQILYDRFINDPSSIGGELPPAVLRALDHELRPLGSSTGPAGISVAKGPESTKPFLPAIDAAAFLGVNLDTFARHIAPTLTPVKGKRHRVYARTDLEAWKASGGKKAR